MYRKWLPAVLAAVMLLAMAAGCSSGRPPVDKKAPSFSLKDMNQQLLSVPYSLHGKKVAVLFFSRT